MQIIVSGLIIGCVYALVALGIVLIYRTTEIVNFAHGEMAMITTFISFVFLSSYELSYLLSFLLAIIFASIFGFFVYLIFMKRIQSAPHLNQIILTLGLFMVFNGIAGLIWGHQPLSFPEAIIGDSVKLGSVYVTKNDLFIVGITFVLMILIYILFRFTKIGLAMRAASQDIMTSELMGIKVNGIFMGTWAIGAVLGGIAGMMTAPITFLTPNMMTEIIIIAFAAAVLGGFISLPGAVVGGLIVGVFENLVSYYIAPEIKLVFVFILIIAVLYVRPHGLFGDRKIGKKV